ncbi:MAG: hypothetical protein GY913_31450 [Proteobacteria bacterium]|nr:hypothetical protein [Pseudomonadota bacterium]MCP4921436.1 hypothetical protein [Pseudomonadota bacterium]
MPLTLFSFMQPGAINDALIRDGLLPWTAHPQVQATLLRPLTALTHQLDHLLWPDSPLLQHAHSLVWWALAALSVGLLYRRTLGVGLAAGLAALLYAVDDSHAMPIAWIANRNALLCIALGVASVLAHLRWREQRGAGWLIGSLGLALLGLLAGEAALGALAYIVAWELTDPERRLVRLVPHTALVVAWRAVYSTLGYGAKHSGLYVDPANNPGEFALALAERGPILMLAQALGLPVDLWLLMPRALQLGLTAAGLVTIALLAWLFGPLLRSDRRARWLGLGMLGALAPLCAAFPMDRLLVFSGIGFFGLLALQIEREQTKTALALLVLCGPFSALAMPARTLGAPAILRAVMTDPIERMPIGPQAADQTWLFVNGMEFSTFYVTLMPQVEGRQGPEAIGLLAPMFRDVTLTGVDEHTLDIHVDQGWLLATGERIARDATPFEVGETIDRPGFQARVDEVTADGRPLDVRFTFDRPLDDPEHVWMCWLDGLVSPCSPPSPGETLTLAATLPSI